MRRIAAIAFFVAMVCAVLSARRTWEPTDVMPLFSTRFSVGLEIAGNYFWVAVPNGVLRFPYWAGEIDFSNWEAFSFSSEVRDIAALGDSIYAFAEDGVYARRAHDFFDVPFSKIEAVPRFAPNIGGCPPEGAGYFMPAGYIWVSDGTIRDFHLNDYVVTDCATDDRGNFYFSTDGAGIFEVPYRSNRAEALGFGPCCDYVSAISRSGSRLFFAGCDDISLCAFTVYDSTDGEFSRIEGEPTAGFPFDSWVNDLVSYGDKVFIATDRGLGMFDLSGGGWMRATGMGSIPIEGAQAIAILKDSIYIAANDGLYSADLYTRLFGIRTPVGVGRFKDVTRVGERIYAVGDMGVWVGADTTFERFDPPDGTLTNFVNCITAGPNGEAVFGARSGILIYYPDGRRTLLSNALILDGSTPYDIVATRRNLWIATKRGLYVYNRISRNSVFLGSRYYLPETPIYRLFLDGDFLWLSTGKGLFRFFWNDPDRVIY